MDESPPASPASPASPDPHSSPTAESNLSIGQLARYVALVPIWMLIAVVRCYQWFISPLLGPQCRFHPTCSHYFIASLRKYGLFVGCYRGLRRIMRCHPWNPGGYDPP